MLSYASGVCYSFLQVSATSPDKHSLTDSLELLHSANAVAFIVDWLFIVT